MQLNFSPEPPSLDAYNRLRSLVGWARLPDQACREAFDRTLMFCCCFAGAELIGKRDLHHRRGFAAPEEDERAPGGGAREDRKIHAVGFERGRAQNSQKNWVVCESAFLSWIEPLRRADYGGHTLRAAWRLRCDCSGGG